MTRYMTEMRQTLTIFIAQIILSSIHVLKSIKIFINGLNGMVFWHLMEPPDPVRFLKMQNGIGRPNGNPLKSRRLSFLKMQAAEI